MANFIVTTPDAVYFGRKLQLGQDATAAQVKADLIEYATNVYKNQKRIEAEEAGASETVEIT